MKALLQNRALAGQFLNAAQGTGLRFFSVGINLIIAIVGARLLGEAGFGRYVAFLAGAGLVATLLGLGLPTLLAREIAHARGTGNAAALPPIAHLLAGLLGALAILILGAALMGWMVTLYTLLFAFSTLLLGVATNVYNGVERVLAGQWVAQVVRPLLLVAGFFALAWAGGLTVETAVLLQTATAAVAALVLLAVWRGPRPAQALRRLWARERLSAYGATLRTGLTFALAQALINAMTQIDVLILALLRGPEEVAWYYAAARAAFAVAFFFGAVSKLAEPRLVRLHAAGRDGEFRLLVRQTAWLGLAMTVLAVLAALLLARPYLRLYGDGYLAAFPAMAVLMAGMVLTASLGPAEPVLRAVRADVGIFLCAGAAVGLGVVVAFALIPGLGLVGAALSTSVQFVTFVFLQSRLAARRTGAGTGVWPSPGRRRAS